MKFLLVMDQNVALVIFKKYLGQRIKLLLLILSIQFMWILMLWQVERVVLMVKGCMKGQFIFYAQNKMILFQNYQRKTLILFIFVFQINPTGTTLTKDQLAKFVDYAKENNAIILFDAAYEKFITENNVPHSIYEIEGAREVAIEFRSFSKTAGFIGARCAYTIVPKELKAFDNDNNP